MAQEQEAKVREGRPPREHREGGRGPREGGGPPRGDRDRRDDRRGGERREGPPEIELEKLISDSLYLDNQAHGVVSRMRDMDSGTKSQLRRLYNAVRRAYRSQYILSGARDEQFTSVLRELTTAQQMARFSAALAPIADDEHAPALAS